MDKKEEILLHQIKNGGCLQVYEQVFKYYYCRIVLEALPKIRDINKIIAIKCIISKMMPLMIMFTSPSDYLFNNSNLLLASYKQKQPFN